MLKLVMLVLFVALAFACPPGGSGSCDCSWTAGGANCGQDDGSECFCRCCCQYTGKCGWNPGPSPGGHSAGTSRYWDCNQPYCEPGRIPYPHSYRMFAMSDGRYFGHAAASDSILQNGGSCEHCYELKYGGKTVVVKVDNWCPCNSNPSCCRDHFDLAVPGTDYAPSSASNVCQQKDSSMNYAKGRQNCSKWPWVDNSSCCNNVSSDQQLNAACKLFTETIDWDNVEVNYNQVSCPYEEMDAYDVFWTHKAQLQEIKNLTALADYQSEFIKEYVKHRNGTKLEAKAKIMKEIFKKEKIIN